MSYPMIGKRYYVEFPTMSFYLHFLSDTSLEFVVEKSPDLPKGSAHSVDVVIEHLRDELYLVSWQEKKRQHGCPSRRFSGAPGPRLPDTQKLDLRPAERLAGRGRCTGGSKVNSNT